MPRGGLVHMDPHRDHRTRRDATTKRQHADQAGGGSGTRAAGKRDPFAFRLQNRLKFRPLHTHSQLLQGRRRGEARRRYVRHASRLSCARGAWKSRARTWATSSGDRRRWPFTSRANSGILRSRSSPGQAARAAGLFGPAGRRRRGRKVG